MRRIIRLGTLFAGGLLLAAQVVRPPRTNPAALPEHHLTSHVPVPPEVSRVLEHSCRDCHSNDTRWPWYSHVAPVSWFVIDHVNHGRSHFNYSDWRTYSPDQATTLLEQTCTMVRGGSMPLGSYLLMHRSARLSEKDVDVLCTWTRDAAVRLAERRH